MLKKLEYFIIDLVSWFSCGDKLGFTVKAADAGVLEAKQKLNVHLQKEENPIGRVAKARIKVYKKRAYSGNKEAQYWYGMSLQGIDNDESLKFLIPLTQQGDIKAMTAIALGYSAYGGYGENDDEYMRWSKMAANAGDCSSQNAVALQYVIIKDYNSAFYWYSKAAEQKSATGFSGMAKCYSYWQIKLHSKETKPSQKEIDEYDEKILNCYIEANRYAISDVEKEEACCGMANHFRGMSYATKDDERRRFLLKKAIFFFMGSYAQGNDNSLKNAQEISKEYNIYVDYRDIGKWAEDEHLFK